MGLLWLGILAVLVLLPSVAAQERVDACSRECRPQDFDVNGPGAQTDAPVKIILYGHFERLLGGAPINTQPPLGGIDGDVNEGFLMPRLVTRTGTMVDFGFENGEFRLFHLPSRVELGMNDQLRYVTMSGMADDLHVLGPTLNGYFYLSPSSVPNAPASPGAPGALAEVRLEMSVRAGHEPDGTLLAYGEGGDGVLLSTPVSTGAPVYEFRIPMVVHRENWSAQLLSRGLSWFVSIRQADTDLASAGQADWRVRSGPDYPPRIILTVANPLVVAPIQYGGQRNGTILRTAAVSPFGSYDVDASSGRLEIRGPGRIGPEHVQLIIARTHLEHGAEFRPVTWLWRIDFRGADAPPGIYTAAFHVRNAQGTYEGTAQRVIVVGNQAMAAQAPGLELSIAILVPLVLALIRRR